MSTQDETVAAKSGSDSGGGAKLADDDGLPIRLGRYELCVELASGGMGTVYLARAEGPGGFDKPVAVKCIHPHMAREEPFVNMFLDEARLSSRIAHPNVCTAFDVGEEGGRFYLAMEYLEGEALTEVRQAMLQQNDPVLLERWPFLCARIIADAAEGLHAAHELRDDHDQLLDLVHRDVSPHNILVTYGGSVRVVDFGIAKARDRLQESTTGALKGKYPYMAPEQLRPGTPISRRVDVWALGVTLWELLSLQRLFRRETTLETLEAVSNYTPPNVRETNRFVPEELAAIVTKALSKDPDKRHATGRELAQELSQVLASRGQVVGLAEVGELMKTLFPDGRRNKRDLLAEARSRSAMRRAAEETTVPTRSRGFPLWLGALAVLGAVGAIGWIAFGSTQPERVATIDEPLDDVVDPPDEDPPPEEPAAELTDAAPPVDAATSAADAAIAVVAARRRTGRVRVVTTNGWADVYHRGRRLGPSPLETELPEGRQSLSLRPFGQGPARRVGVRVRADRPNVVRVDLSSNN